MNEIPYDKIFLAIIFFILGCMVFQAFGITPPMSSVSKDDIRLSFKTIGGNQSLVIEIKGEHSMLWVGNTSSMYPVLRDGNTFIVQPNPTKISIYDIVVARNNECPEGIIHQVIGIDDNCIYTKGTHSLFADGICWKPEDIKFKVIGVIWTGDD